MSSIIEALRAFFGDTTVLTLWGVAVFASLALLAWDIVVRRAGYSKEAAEAQQLSSS